VFSQFFRKGNILSVDIGRRKKLICDSYCHLFIFHSKEIGKGGFGVVWKAHNKHDCQEVKPLAAIANKISNMN